MTDTRAIAHYCTYITDDGTIAAYCSIDRAQVATIRANIKPPQHTRFKAKRCESGNDGTGRDAERNARIAAQVASKKLYNMIERMFERYAKRKGITAAEAQTLMLNYGCRN